MLSLTLSHSPTGNAQITVIDVVAVDDTSITDIPMDIVTQHFVYLCVSLGTTAHKSFYPCKELRWKSMNATLGNKIDHPSTPVADDYTSY